MQATKYGSCSRACHAQRPFASKVEYNDGKKCILSLSDALPSQNCASGSQLRSARLVGKASPLFQLNGLDDSRRPTNACREDATIPIKLFIDPLLSDRKIVRRYIRGDNKATHLSIFYYDRPILIKPGRYHCLPSLN